MPFDWYLDSNINTSPWSSMTSHNAATDSDDIDWRIEEEGHYNATLIRELKILPQTDGEQ